MSKPKKRHWLKKKRNRKKISRKKIRGEKGKRKKPLLDKQTEKFEK